MRVIAGTAKKKPLCASDQPTMQPTVDRVKEALFSRIQFEIPQRVCLDLFAGSGQLGIEALSRGAAFCDFVELTREAADCIRKNIRTCGFENRSRLICADAFDYIVQTDRRYDLVFLDPPFHHELLSAVLPKVYRLLRPGAIVYCESHIEDPEPPEIDGLERFAQSRYGTIRTTFYRMPPEEPPLRSPAGTVG